MKNLIKTLFVVAVLVGISVSTNAQTVDEPIQTQQQLRDGSGLGVQAGVDNEFRTALMSTFSEEQMEILQNTEMTREERQEALHATFTEEQLALLETQQQFRSENMNQNGMGLGEGEMNQVRTRAKMQSEGSAAEEAAQVKQQMRKNMGGNAADGEIQEQIQQHAGDAYSNGYRKGGNN